MASVRAERSVPFLRNLMSSSDSQLLKNFLRGDRQSFDMLVQQYLQPIYSFIYRFTQNKQNAEDLTQEVFVKLWKNAKKIKPEKNFKTWLFSIAKNASLDFLKKKKTIPFSHIEEEIIPDCAPLPDEILKNAEISSGLNSILTKLPLNHRLVVFLRYNDHFKFREIAKILGEPLNTVKNRHLRALKMLKKLLLP